PVKSLLETVSTSSPQRGEVGWGAQPAMCPCPGPPPDPPATAWAEGAQLNGRPSPRWGEVTNDGGREGGILDRRSRSYAPASVQRPAAASSWGDSAMTRTPHACALACAGEFRPAWTMSALTLRCAR